MILKQKALEFAQHRLSGEQLSSFAASADFINRVLKQNGFRRVKLHGESGEIDVEVAQRDMAHFRQQLEELCNNQHISSERIKLQR